MTAAAHRPDRKADRARRRHAGARRARRRRRRGGGRGRAEGRRGNRLARACSAIRSRSTRRSEPRRRPQPTRARFVIELRAELDPSLYRGLLRARRPVLVRGVGRRFSGVYYVQSVRTDARRRDAPAELRRDAQRHRTDRPGELRPVRRGGAGAVSEPTASTPAAGRSTASSASTRASSPTSTTRRRSAGSARRCPRCSARRSTAAGRCRACRPAAARSAGCCSSRRSATPCGSSSRPATSAARSGSARSGGRRTARAAPTISAPRPAPRRRRATTARTPRRRCGVLKTKSGHELTFDDDGEVVLLANGNGKSVDPLRAGRHGRRSPPRRSSSARRPAEKVVLGDTFMQFFNQHTHPTGRRAVRAARRSR